MVVCIRIFPRCWRNERLVSFSLERCWSTRCHKYVHKGAHENRRKYNVSTWNWKNSGTSYAPLAEHVQWRSCHSYKRTIPYRYPRRWSRRVCLRGQPYASKKITGPAESMIRCWALSLRRLLEILDKERIHLPHTQMFRCGFPIVQGVLKWNVLDSNRDDNKRAPKCTPPKMPSAHDAWIKTRF